MLRCGILISLAAFSLVVLSNSSIAADNALIKYCKADIERLCAGVEPGGGRLLECLKSHKEEMTVGCAQALQKLKGKMGK